MTRGGAGAAAAIAGTSNASVTSPGPRIARV
jgi:hypothetical protein